MTVSPALADILRALLDGKQFGWEIMSATGRASGTVYPALKRLAAAGWLEWEWHDGGNPRRCYTLTELGTAEAKRALNIDQ